MRKLGYRSIVFLSLIYIIQLFRWRCLFRNVGWISCSAVKENKSACVFSCLSRCIHDVCCLISFSVRVHNIQTVDSYFICFSDYNVFVLTFLLLCHSFFSRVLRNSTLHFVRPSIRSLFNHFLLFSCGHATL